MPRNKHEFDFTSSASVAFDAALVGGDAYPDRGGGRGEGRKRRSRRSRISSSRRSSSRRRSRCRA